MHCAAITCGHRGASFVESSGGGGSNTIPLDSTLKLRVVIDDALTQRQHAVIVTSTTPGDSFEYRVQFESKQSFEEHIELHEGGRRWWWQLRDSEPATGTDDAMDEE